MRTLVVVLVLVATACSGPVAQPRLRVVDGTPGDLRVLAEETFASVLDAFPARHDCLDGVGLVAAWELPDRARYDPARREITIRVPATAQQLRVALVHELAHDLEFSCASHAEVRSAFVAAQEIPPGTPWVGGTTWETTPSEHWATAVVEHVLGRPDTQARIAVGPATLEVVRGWAFGR